MEKQQQRKEVILELRDMIADYKDKINEMSIVLDKLSKIDEIEPLTDKDWKDWREKGTGTFNEYLASLGR